MKKITTFLVIMISTFLLVGCSNNDNNNVTDTVKKDLDTIDETVKNDIKNATEYSRDKIDEAVTYIHENVDNMKDRDVAKKVYQYSTYLDSAATSAKDASEHDISKFASKTKEYASNVYQASKDDVDDIINNSKDAIKSMDTNIHNDKDRFIDEFQGLVNTKKDS